LAKLDIIERAAAIKAYTGEEVKKKIARAVGIPPVRLIKPDTEKR
jgi:hypothetical protein